MEGQRGKKQSQTGDQGENRFGDCRTDFGTGGKRGGRGTELRGNGQACGGHPRQDGQGGHQQQEDAQSRREGEERKSAQDARVRGQAGNHG